MGCKQDAKHLRWLWLQRCRGTRATHCKDLGCEAHVVLPCHTQDIGQVQGEVDDSPAGSSQVGPGEERANQEALQDGHSGKNTEEEEHHTGVAVGQQVSQLERKRLMKCAASTRSLDESGFIQLRDNAEE